MKIDGFDFNLGLGRPETPGLAIAAFSFENRYPDFFSPEIFKDFSRNGYPR